MNEMWKMLLHHKLTPNEFYLLYSMRESTTTPLINTNLELRGLSTKGWINDKNVLTTKAKRVLKEVESYFKRSKTKSNILIMGDDFIQQIVKYNDLWPKIKLPTGKAARSAKGNLEPGFRWFFQTYEFDWAIIMKATNFYLDEREKENWNYTRTSQYFIRKQNTDKSWSSDLADCCQLIEDGGGEQSKDHFKEKIF